MRKTVVFKLGQQHHGRSSHWVEDDMQIALHILDNLHTLPSELSFSSRIAEYIGIRVGAYTHALATYILEMESGS